MPGHVRPALVEPRPADRRGRREGRACRPPRPVRPAGRPAQPGRAARRAARRDRPPGRDRRPRRARRHRRTRRGRAPRERVAARISWRSAGRGSSGRSGRCSPAWSSPSRRRRAGLRPDTVVVPSATGGTQAGLLVGLRTAGLATTVHGVAVTPPEPLRSAIAAIVTGLGGHRRSGRRSTTRTIVLDGTPARRRLRPADRGRRGGDQAAGTHRGDPGRPDLHGQGPGRPGRAGPRRRARRPPGRLLARRRDARPVRAARRLTRT